jgi:small subunit ribosomal protein S11
MAKSNKVNKVDKARNVRKKNKVQVREGIAIIHARFNNTIVVINDRAGNLLVWGTSGKNGFKGSRKRTPFAAQQTAEKVAISAMEEYGMTHVDIQVNGGGPGREGAIRGLHSAIYKKSKKAVVSEEGEQKDNEDGSDPVATSSGYTPNRSVGAQLNVLSIEDITRIPHNGCKESKERRV